MTRNKSAGIIKLTVMAFLANHIQAEKVFCPEESPLKPYLCPGSDDVCVADYHHCQLMSSACNESVLPFRCPTATQSSSSAVCVGDPSTDCCPVDLPVLCPHSGECVATAETCCSLSADTPFYCQTTRQCVKNQFDCCQELDANNSPLAQCSTGGKCARKDSWQNCFMFQAECSDSKYPYLCQYDGQCKEKETDCAAPRVCPPGYTQCADRTCVPGHDNFDQCYSLRSCKVSVQGTLVRFMRCPDGITCVTSLENCGTETTCANSGDVVCPDGSCASSEYLCNQPPMCQVDDDDEDEDEDRLHLCAGMAQGLCVTSRSECPAVANSIVCPPDLLKCENGQCASSCDDQPSVPDCLSQNKVLCPTTLTCASSHAECVDQTYCPLVESYTWSPSTVLCGGGAQVCANNVEECVNSQCQSSLFYGSFPEKLNPFPSFDITQIQTCPDGRCMQSGCLTPFSCSPGYIKMGGFGEFCLRTQEDAGVDYMQLAIQLQANFCGASQVKCLTGECRANYDDCPQQTTCPETSPVKCRDGRCTQEKSECRASDGQIEGNIAYCAARNKLLCPSDFKTCVDSLQKCPTKSTCPWGLKKCDEGTCVSPFESCPDVTVPTTCTFFCENEKRCVTAPSECRDIDSCPLESPVLCAMDNLCYASAHDCQNPLNEHALFADMKQSRRGRTQQNSRLGTDTTVIDFSVPDTPRPYLGLKLALASVTCNEGSYLCEDGCSTTPCPEWTTCHNGGVQCWNGLCASSVDYCTSPSNGCPFHLPVNCPYTPSCVKDMSECSKTESEAKSYLDTQCSQNMPSTPVGCKWSSCVANEAACPADFPANCADYTYPNNVKATDNDFAANTCYIPQCPQDLPHKCPSGLCVTEPYHCPTTGDLPIEFYQECYNISTETGGDVRVPCGDGTCVSHPSQCPPMYDCAKNPTNVYRCSDGTCKASLTDCRTQPTSTYKCSGTHGKICQNGMCAAESDTCINELGCPLSTPKRCEHTGECISSTATCDGQLDLMKDMSISKTRNFCQRQGGMGTCFTANAWQSLMYCTASPDTCFHTDSECSIDEPVRCCGKCVEKLEDCASYCSSDSFASNNLLQSTSPSVKTHPMVGTAYTLNSNLCTESRPFRCGTGSTSDCQNLPYTSYPDMFYRACTTEVQQLEETHLRNRCLSAQLPFACADGSCVASAGECASCHYFCPEMGMCVADYAECSTYDALSTATKRRYTQLCPQGLPYRCITTGECVQSALYCATHDRIQSRKAVLAQNFIGPHIDPTCSYTDPIRCANGECVDHYESCLSVGHKASPAFGEPAIWGSSIEDNENFDPCQVVCQDGSCRDRQENCPLILPCSSPQKPHRCRSGYCARNQSECADFFGTVIEDEPAAEDLYSASCDDGTAQRYVRCEDGICRPATLDAPTGNYNTTCLDYIGCSTLARYQCPTGQCVTSMEECETSPYCYAGSHSGLYQCKNMDCLDSPDECPEAAASQPSLQMELSVNPFVDNTFEFAFLGQQAVARLVLPANALRVDLSSEIGTNYFERDIYQKIVFNPVPQRLLEQTTNFIQIDNQDVRSAQEYLNQWFTLLDGGYLTSYDSIVGPPVLISNYVKDVHYSETLLNANADSRIEYYLDEDSLPSLLSNSSDFCIARMVSTTSEPVTNTTATGWACITRDLRTTSDGWWSFPIRSLGTYALIINPDPLLIEWDGPCENVWCEYKLYIIIGGLGFFALVALVFFLILCCKRRRKTYAHDSDDEEGHATRPLNPPEQSNQPHQQQAVPSKVQPHKKYEPDTDDDGSLDGHKTNVKEIDSRGNHKQSANPQIQPFINHHRDSLGQKDADAAEVGNVINDFQQYGAGINASLVNRDGEAYLGQNYADPEHEPPSVTTDHKGGRRVKNKKKRKRKQVEEQSPSPDKYNQYSDNQQYDVDFDNTARARNQYDDGEQDQLDAVELQQEQMFADYGLENFGSESSHQTNVTKSVNESLPAIPVSRKADRRGKNRQSGQNTSVTTDEVRFQNNFIEQEQARYQDPNQQRSQIPNRRKKRGRRDKSKSPSKPQQQDNYGNSGGAQRPRREKPGIQKQQYQEDTYRNDGPAAYGLEDFDDDNYEGGTQSDQNLGNF